MVNEPYYGEGEDSPRVEKIGGLYGFLKGLAKWYFDNFREVKIIGEENIPAPGEPLIIASNHDTPNRTWYFDKRKRGRIVPHTHSVDHLLIMAYFNQKIHAVASIRHYRSGVKSYLLDVLEQIQASSDEVIKGAEKYLGKGESILIFPEGNSGQGTLFGKKREVHRGLGKLVSNHNKIKVLPVHVTINGKKDWVWPKFESATLVIGKPFLYEEVYGKLPRLGAGGVDYKTISEQIVFERIFPLSLEGRLDPD